MSTKTDSAIAWGVKVAAVVAAAPRLIVAVMRAEGFELPTDWLAWWVPLSAGMAASMAILEGVAFSYVFGAWRQAQGKHADRLLGLAALSALAFVGTVAPSVFASVSGSSVAQVFAGAPWALWTWSVAVVLSTLTIVASVGYAQKTTDTPTRPEGSPSEVKALAKRVDALTLALEGVAKGVEALTLRGSEGTPEGTLATLEGTPRPTLRGSRGSRGSTLPTPRGSEGTPLPALEGPRVGSEGTPSDTLATLRGSEGSPEGTPEGLTCPDCGKGFKTLGGLKGHRPHCKGTPSPTLQGSEGARGSEGATLQGPRGWEALALEGSEGEELQPTVRTPSHNGHGGG